MRCQCQYLCLLLISFQTRWAAFNQVPVSTWRWYNRKNIFSSSKNICCSGGLGAEPDVRGDGARDGGGAHPLVPRRGAAQHRRQGRRQHPQWQGQHHHGYGSSILTSMLWWKHNICRRREQIGIYRGLYSVHKLCDHLQFVACLMTTCEMPNPINVLGSIDIINWGTLNPALQCHVP